MSDTPGTIPAAPPADVLTADKLPEEVTPRRRRRSAAGGAPAATGPTDGPKRAPRKRAPRKAPRIDIADGMAKWYIGAGVVLARVPSAPAVTDPEHTVTQVVGRDVAAASQACGQAWAEFAETDERVRAALEKFLSTSAAGRLISAHIPIVIAAGLATGTIPQWVLEFFKDDEPAEVLAP